jgi:FkbM family methyltransferase
MNLADLKELYHRPLRRLGVDVVRYDTGGRRLVSLLGTHGIDVVLDVGANTGQYGERLRKLGYRGRIVSYEPMAEAFALLAATAARDASWSAAHIGLGDEDTTSVINVAANSVSSSVLPMSDDLVRMEPTTRAVREETITVRRLDSVIDDHCDPGARPFLKLDVQGFEARVLDGAAASLDRVIGLQVEMAVEPLYVGQVPMLELLGRLDAAGFRLTWIEPGFHTPEGRMLECDGIFFRR